MVLDKKKVIGLAYLTDELLIDAPAAQSIVSDAFTSELAFTIANAVFRGSGAGQPQGFLNSGATASVAIEAAQTIANTAQSIAINTSKMLARVPASLWGDVIFLYNQELLPKLAVATIGTSGAVPVFMGAGGMSGKPYDTIWGRPAYASELCEAEGTAGDIICMAPNQYAVLGGDATYFSESIHVRFVNDETALRFTTRIDGAPEWVSTITRFKGTAALSPFVTLALRT
jgi:HK97 family phage major capsid protein